MLLVDQDIAITRLSKVKVNNCLIRVTHGPRFNPGLHLFLRGKLKHAPHLSRRAVDSPSYVQAVEEHSQCADRREVAPFMGAGVMVSADLLSFKELAYG